MNKYNYLIRNTAIISIGSFGSKVISYLIVPLYTYLLTNAEYGIIDLFTTTMTLIIPFTTLSMQEANIRFLTAKELDEKTIINNSFLVYVFGGILMVFIVGIVDEYLAFSDYINYFIVFVLLGGYNRIFGEHMRASGKIIQYSIYGVISTSVFVICNLLFLLVLKMGMVGYFRSLVIAEMICAIYVTVVNEIACKLSLSAIDIKALKIMLAYCIPLIPNNVMWWIMNSGDKYIISYFLGNGANGIYSLAMKIPTVLSVMFSIFIQAWQLSAIEEDKKEGQATFYTNVFNAVFGLLMICASIITILIKPLFKLIIDPSFYDSWRYVPLLAVATILNCIATFCGITYVVNKKSIDSFYTTVIGAVVNLLFNFYLVGSYGLYGIVTGTIFGYLAVVIIRMKHTKKEFGLNFYIYRLITAILVLVLQSIVMMRIVGIMGYFLSSICCIIVILLYKDYLSIVIYKSSSLIKTRVKRKG